MKSDLDSLCIQIQVDTNRKAQNKRERTITRNYLVKLAISVSEINF